MAGKKKKKQEEGGSSGAPMWIVTFSDLMSLLLTFFVLLLSFSSIQEVEFQKALGSLKGALGVLPRQDAIFSPVKTKFPRAIIDQKMKYDKAAQELKKGLKALDDQLKKMRKANAGQNNSQSPLDTENKSSLLEMIEIRAGKDGMVIRIDSPLLYSLGEAKLRHTAYPVLDEIVKVVADWPNTIRIEGHTDNLPINTVEFPSNWELSTARALSVLRYFESTTRINPARLSALGFGEHHPLFPNNSEANRAKNRRVEIYVEPPQNRPLVDYSFMEEN